MRVQRKNRTTKKHSKEPANIVAKILKPSNSLKIHNRMKYPKNESGPEHKYIEIFTGGFNTSTTGQLSLTNACVQGTANGNRIGQKILMTSCHFKVEIGQTINGLNSSTGLTNTQSFNMVRVMLVYDKQPNNAAFSVSSDLLTGSSVQLVQGNRQETTRERFVVLYDKTKIMQAGGPNAVKFEKYVKFRLPTTYSTGNAGTIADIESGSLYLVYIDQNTNGNLPAQGLASIRVNYVDN